MNLQSTLLPLSAVLVLGTSFAQEPGGDAAGGGPARLPPVAVPVHTAADGEGLPYGTWAGGETWKASFHDGMTFVPLLGFDYPHNQPFHWRTASVSLAGKELLPAEPPVMHTASWRVEYDFGAITEAYDVRPDGLEQSFVVRERPHGAGDLVVRGEVSTGLHAAPAPAAHRELVFLDGDDRAIVRYGAATAVDAHGARVPVATAFDGTGVTLTVPGAWLATAAFPIVVDPLLSRGLVAVWGGPAGVGQATWTRISIHHTLLMAQRVLVVNTRAASAGDLDVVAHVCEANGTNAVIIFTDFANNWDSDQTCCAIGGRDYAWAIVFRRYFRNATPPVSRILAHLHDFSDLTLGTSVLSLPSIPANRNDWRPSVGGTPPSRFHTGAGLLVTFQREDDTATGGAFAETDDSDVFAVALEANVLSASYGFGSPFAVFRDMTTDYERPTVNQQAEAASPCEFVVLCQAYDTTVAGDDWDVIGKRVDASGGVASGLFTSTVGAPGTQHQLQPVVAGAGGRYAVLFATIDTASVPNKPSTTIGKALFLQRFDWAAGAANPGAPGLPVPLRATVDQRWQATGLAYDNDTASHWVAGFRTILASGGEAWYARVGHHGLPTEGPDVLYQVAGDDATGTSCTYDDVVGALPGTGLRFHFAYGVDDAAATYPVYTQALEYVVPAPVTTTGTGCSGAILGVWGTNVQQIGHQFCGIDTTGAPANAVHFLLLSFAGAGMPIVDPVVAPGCWLLVDTTAANYVGMLGIQVGTDAYWTLALPEFLSPASLYFQDWILDPATSLFASTRQLKVPIVR